MSDYDVSPVSPDVCTVSRLHPDIFEKINQGLLHGDREIKLDDILRGVELDALRDSYRNVGWHVNVVECSHNGLHLIFSIPEQPKATYVVEYRYPGVLDWHVVAGPFDTYTEAMLAVKAQGPSVESKTRIVLKEV